MSERWASSCRGKKHYNSEHRADEAAKASQIVYQVPMNAYKCDYCGRWHVGNTFARNGKRARMQQENDSENNSLDKAGFVL